MTTRSSAAAIVRVGAVVVFTLAWLVLLLVVLIGAGYGSDDPLLAVYVGMLVVGAAVVWRGATRDQTAAHAALSAGAIVVTLWLGSTYG